MGTNVQIKLRIEYLYRFIVHYNECKIKCFFLKSKQKMEKKVFQPCK